MRDLMCIDNKNSPFMLSRREALASKRQKPVKIRHFRNLRPGRLLRCSYVANCDLGIYVLPLIFDFTENILVKTTVSIVHETSIQIFEIYYILSQDIVSKGEPLPRFIKDQSVLAKILTIDHDTREIRLTIKDGAVFDNSVEVSCNFLLEI